MPPPGHQPPPPESRPRQPEKRGWWRRRWDDCTNPGCDCPDCGPLLLVPMLGKVLVGATRSTAVDPWTVPAATRTGRLGARLIRSYQVNVSVPRARPVCNLTPSCSRYGLEAVAELGALRGSVAVARRLAQCRRAGNRLRQARRWTS